MRRRRALPAAGAALAALLLAAACSDDESQPPAGLVVPGPGWTLYKRFGCNVCHSLDGSRGVGPTFKGAYGTERELADGTKVVMDDAYIEATLVAKTRAARAGFDPRVMPNFKNRIRDDEVRALIDLIKAVK